MKGDKASFCEPLVSCSRRSWTIGVPSCRERDGTDAGASSLAFQTRHLWSHRCAVSALLTASANIAGGLHCPKPWPVLLKGSRSRGTKTPNQEFAAEIDVMELKLLYSNAGRNVKISLHVHCSHKYSLEWLHTCHMSVNHICSIGASLINHRSRIELHLYSSLFKPK